ncbi:acetoacetate--CoA ligase [Virgisporangium ochraceum]|uniref:Acetoacetyl-CoA synthetase n=1 Tax=Virgisporangium ochraceum TaxID=65505 RepID=A0A8J4A2W9_9ACTN|nr:acetoacetate--CoA ligase [Virgisporangium ochraceum]GIJ72870.1 acetoacetyl-CoA synthetase [Virgisporangium ochraceum]
MTSQTPSTPRPVAEGDVLRPVPSDARATSGVGAFLGWLERHRGLAFADYDELWRWSVDDLDGFWGAVAAYFGVRFSTPYERVLTSRSVSGARWFTGSTVNYAEHMVGLVEDPAADADDLAVLAYSQTREPIRLTWGELRDQVARARAGLRRLGVGHGDRVVAYLPNVPEALVAFLATASLGAVWSSCATEFGARSVVDRFSQLEPTVLLAVPGYVYGGRSVDRRARVVEVAAGLPTLTHVVEVPYGAGALDAAFFGSPALVGWDDLLAAAPTGPALFDPVPFDHPLYVLFSSGTTGRPKAIVHGHGGILVEHLKNHALHWDLRPGDRLLWYTTTSWMMWNALVSALLLRAVPVMIDGNPFFPDLMAQWRLAARVGATLVGVSPGYVMACRKEGLAPWDEVDLSAVRQIGCVGSPLPVDGFSWLQNGFGPRVLLNVGSGGTDVCSGIVQGGPLQPVLAGQMSGAALGVAAAAFDHDNAPVVGDFGELVITAPMPSMPVGFWGDPDGRAYRAAYFDDIPGVWRHGDWIRFTDRGSCVITGRSDATLNRGGVRLGTADFYAVVEELPDIVDSLVVHLEDPDGGPGELILFVVHRDGLAVDDDVRRRVVEALRTNLSPRHVPDAVVGMAAVPRGRTGKKLELPVKRILQGADPDTVVSRDALADPQALVAYVEEARRRQVVRW